MKTKDLRQDDGRLTGFIVSNFLLSRHGAAKIVKRIPGAEIRRKQKPFRLSGPDDFCEFELAGKTFLVIEPFGDNSEFWVVADPPEESSQLEKVREEFERHRTFSGLLGS